MEKLFEKLSEFNDDAYRNVVKISKDFSDIIDKPSDLEAIDLVLDYIGKTKTVDPKEEFYYTAAIGYPFTTNHYTVSRYSDSTFPVWYGSTKAKTTIYETGYHMYVDEKAVEHIQDENIIYRDRIIYTVFCDAVLIDLVGKENSYPGLTSNAYDFTQTLGQKICEQGHPGLTSPSARCKGINLDIFKKEVLSKPKPLSHLTYEFNVKTNELKVVFEKTKKSMVVQF